MALTDKRRWAPLLSAAALLAAILSAAGCGIGEPLQKNAGISLWKGTVSFETHYKELDSAKGILPPALTTGLANGSILRVSPVNFHEYFVYDDKTTLLILSLNPFYYIKLESREFRFHLDSEYNQFAANPGLTPSQKIINTTTHYKEVGDSRAALYFSPAEIHFTSSGTNRYRIKDANSITSVDLWKLLDAAEYAAVYTPVFEDITLFTDLHTQKQSGKQRLVYTRESALTPKNYSLLENPFPGFTFIAGKNLSLTSEILGTESEFFIDRVEMTRDFIFFFSSPLGNSADKGYTDYLNMRHGLALQVRGSLDSYINFFEDEGINLDPGSQVFLSIYLSENSGDPATVTVNWFENRPVQVWYSFDGDEFSMDAELTASSRIIGQTVDRGRKLWIRLAAPGSGMVMAEDSITIAKVPAYGDIDVTEIMWMGTMGAVKYDYDEFIEVKNTSDYYLNLKDLKITIQKTAGTDSPGSVGTLLEAGTLGSYTLAPGAYFLLIRQLNYLFSRDNLNPAPGSFYQKSFSVSLGNPSAASDEFTVRVYNNISLLNQTAYTRDTGFNDTSAFTRKSAVRLSGGSLGTSANDVNINDFTGRTFCSPGYAAGDEY